jgi:sulfatase modifying factor 1
MKPLSLLMFGVWLLLAATPARAGDRESGGAAPARETGWVTVGHPGNPSDRTGLGTVAEPFQIMQHEVTCGQYAEFLNAVAASDPHGLWDVAMGNALARETDPPPARIGDDRVAPVMIDRIGADGSFHYRVAPGMERMPIVNVSFLDALRFANWLHHAAAGEAGTSGLAGAGPVVDQLTETGAYDIASAGAQAERAAAARVWIPSEDEWYKAAYHHPEAEGGPPGSYWLYPTRSHEPPLFRPAGARDPGSANFLDESVAGRLPDDIGRRPRSEFVHLFPVGSFPEAASFYGTLDQGGNAWEWTDSVVFATQRVLRGGSMAHRITKLRATVRSSAAADRQYGDTGFRLARRVPPSSGGGG